MKLKTRMCLKHWPRKFAFLLFDSVLLPPARSEMLPDFWPTLNLIGTTTHLCQSKSSLFLSHLDDTRVNKVTRGWGNFTSAAETLTNIGRTRLVVSAVFTFFCDSSKQLWFFIPFGWSLFLAPPEGLQMAIPTTFLSHTDPKPLLWQAWDHFETTLRQLWDNFWTTLRPDGDYLVTNGGAYLHPVGSMTLFIYSEPDYPWTFRGRKCEL